MDDKPQKIEVFHSILSEKTKLLKNGKVIEVSKAGVFVKSFDINGHSCSLIQHGDRYEMRIDNQSFQHMLDLQRNKEHFGGGNVIVTSNVSKNHYGINAGKTNFSGNANGNFGMSNQSKNPFELGK